MRKLIEGLERTFRFAVVYPVLRLVFRNPVSDVKLNLQSVERLLIFRYDRIGDMIVTIPILRALKRRNPGLWLAVLASQANAELLRNDLSINEVYVLQRNWLKLLRMILQLRKRNFDVVLNFVFNRTTGPGILANVIAPKAYKVGQGPDRYAFYFNRLLKLPRFEKHMVESLASYMEEVFGFQLSEDERKFEIPIAEGAARAVDEFLQENFLHRRLAPQPHRFPYIVFNLSANDDERRISVEQAKALSRHLSGKSRFRTVLLFDPDDQEMREAVTNEKAFSGCVLFRTRESSPLAQIASLVGGALLVITPDTSIIHFASAMRTPVLGLYTSLQGMQEWLPYRIQHEIVTAPTGEPAANIPLATLVEKADKFIASVLALGSQLESRII